MARIKKEYGIVLLAVLLCVFPFFIREYSTDSYTIEMVGFKSFGDWLKNNGRLITAGAFYLFDAMSADIGAFYYFSFLLAILCMSLAIYHFWWVLNGFMAKKSAFFLGHGKVGDLAKGHLTLNTKACSLQASRGIDHPDGAVIRHLVRHKAVKHIQAIASLPSVFIGRNDLCLGVDQRIKIVPVHRSDIVKT